MTSKDRKTEWQKERQKEVYTKIEKAGVGGVGKGGGSIIKIFYSIDLN